MRLGAFSAALALLAATSSGALAQKKYDTGATDTEIKIGNIMPYSGPASAYGVIGKTEEAYFKKINAEGGINGRKINFISYDDAYSPPKTVEQARKLVESDEVLIVFNPLGTPPNSAIQKYLNTKKVPQLFVATGATKWNDPKDFPWTMGWQPNYQSETQIYAKYILKNKPDAKIGVLYQNDDYGKDYLKGFKDGLGAKARIDDRHGGKLRSLRADHRLPHRQAEVDRRRRVHEHHHAEIRGAGDQEERRDRLEAAALPQQRLGLDRQRHQAGRLRECAGHHLLRTISRTRPTRSGRTMPGMKAWNEFLDKYYPEANRADASVMYAYTVAQGLVHVLKACGDDLTRANIMKQAASIKDLELGGLLPGIKVNTSATDFAPISQVQLMKFKGDTWELFGEILSGDVGG